MKDLTTGNEAKLILSFTIPMLIGNVFQQSYNIVDSVIVGHVIGKTALAAVGACFPVLFLLIALLMGVTMGFSVLISQYYGAKNMERIRRAVDTSYIFLFAGSFVISAVGLVFCGPILRSLNTPADIFPQAMTVLRITFSGIIFLFGFNSISAILRGLGDSKTPLYFLIVSSVLNIILVVLFIKTLGWGVAGSAWATVIAQGTAFIMGVIYLNRTHEVLRLRLRGMRLDTDILKKSLVIGLPSGVQQMLIAGGMMAISRLVNGFGTDAVAAFTAAGRIDTFAIMPAMNLSVAISTFVGQNLGAGKHERVKAGLLASLRISTWISICISLLVLMLPHYVVSIFTSDANVINIGSRYLMIAGGFYIVFSTMVVMNGVMRGAGDTVIPMFITVLTLWIVRIPLSGWLSSRVGVDGLWWGGPMAWMVGLTCSVIYFMSGRWKRHAVAIAAARPVPNPDEDESEWNCSNF